MSICGTCKKCGGETVDYVCPDCLRTENDELKVLLRPFLAIAEQMPEEWPDDAHVRMESHLDLQPPYSRTAEAIAVWKEGQCERPILPTVGHFRAIVKMMGEEK